MLTEDVYYETKEGKLPFRYRLAYGIFGQWTARFATKIMAISETSKKNIAKLYNINPNRIIVNYPGVDFSDHGGNPNQGDYILYIGQAFPRRHLKETILAFEKLITQQKEHPYKLENIGMSELILIAIGPDKYETPSIGPLVSEVNNRLGRQAVIHKDYVKDNELVDLYDRAKALMYVSDREAFGLPPMEALSFGVPPVVMDNELGHELFGDNAFYVQNPNPDGIAEGIHQALTQTEKNTKIKTAGPAFARQYNWNRFTDMFLEFIRDREKLFIYGTLQDPETQEIVFKRTIRNKNDTIAGYRKSEIIIDGVNYPIITPDHRSEVSGKVIEITSKELAAADQYETTIYKRIRVNLKSGQPAWVYVKN